MNDVMLPSRRTVVRTAAWTVPVVAVGVSAPAFAASCGTTVYPYTLNWGSVAYSTVTTGPAANRVKTGTATVDGPAGSTPVVATFTSRNVGVDTRTGNNLTVNSTTYPNVGATGSTGLLLQHQDISAGRNTSRQELRIQFDRAVTGLKFTITDIDSNNVAGNNRSADFWDRVELSGTRTFTATSRDVDNVYVIGAGVSGAESSTTEGPWRMYDNGVVATDNGDASGNIEVTYVGDVQDITLTYWNARGNGNQAVFLSTFTFKASGC
ncbi:hypothetical protein [Nocardioides sp.]|uniref:hypothetical protein n=1 Tax=Nocardioides sp. TaxID=35761 RepID=UPI00261F3B9E|nr:hypothetical protein [Nocardioides sp.]MCW2737137.1 hypothetical protein [Nocardioides sp.]